MMPPVVVAPHGPASLLAADPELDAEEPPKPELDPDPLPPKPELDPEPEPLNPELDPDPELPKPELDPDPPWFPNPELEPEPEPVLPESDPKEGEPEDDDEVAPPSSNPGLPLLFAHPPPMAKKPPAATVTKPERVHQHLKDIAELLVREEEKALPTSVATDRSYGRRHRRTKAHSSSLRPTSRPTRQILLVILATHRVGDRRRRFASALHME
jgi:hypothetical protein